VLRAAVKRVREGGRVVVADEVFAARGWQRVLQRILRGPQCLLAWLLAGGVSKPVPDLRAELETAGLDVTCEQRWLYGTLALYVGEAKR
jgi:hypothetical protein